MWVWPQNPFERCLPPLLVFPEQPKEAMGTVIQVKKLLFFLLAPSTQSKLANFYGQWQHLFTQSPLTHSPEASPGHVPSPQVWHLVVTHPVKYTAPK